MRPEEMNPERCKTSPSCLLSGYSLPQVLASEDDISYRGRMTIQLSAGSDLPAGEVDIRQPGIVQLKPLFEQIGAARVVHDFRDDDRLRLRLQNGSEQAHHCHWNDPDKFQRTHKNELEDKQDYRQGTRGKIGRASCRERVCTLV